jgi:hypothetical protein
VPLTFLGQTNNTFRHKQPKESQRILLVNNGFPAVRISSFRSTHIGSRETPWRCAISDAAKTDPSVEVQWLSGLKLWLVMMPLCFAFFLVLLDISIIATVSLRSMEPISVSLQTLTQHYRRSHKLPTSSTLSRTWAGTEQHTSSPVRLCSL